MVLTLKNLIFRFRILISNDSFTKVELTLIAGDNIFDSVMIGDEFYY